MASAKGLLSELSEKGRMLPFRCTVTASQWAGGGEAQMSSTQQHNYKRPIGKYRHLTDRLVKAKCGVTEESV